MIAKKSPEGAYKKIDTFGGYLKKKYGCKVGKIPVAVNGFTCPNIDGTVAKGGCTFCLNESFSPNLSNGSKKIFLNLRSSRNPLLNIQLAELHRQIRSTRQMMKKQGYKKFIVYFQAFTNTYAPLDTLKTLYESALKYDDVVGISIGTRSDSITDDTLEYIGSLSKNNEIWIEYGVQSIFDKTLETINRGHNIKSVEDAVKNTKKYNINVCAHLIFGLPRENHAMMLESAKTVYGWGVDSIKYHPLYIVKKTVLANEYANSRYLPISLSAYIDILEDVLKAKPENITVQRITAGIDNDTLLAPEWCGYPKNMIVSRIKKELAGRGLLL